MSIELWIIIAEAILIVALAADLWRRSRAAR